MAIGADGANVNMGQKKGLVALLKDNIPWLVAIHCLNHRLELAARDAFKSTYLEDVISMLMNLYSLYSCSPKRMRDLKALADIMEEDIPKPQKANGTRWLQHKQRACDSLIKGYSVIVAHLENCAEDQCTPKKDQAKPKGFLRQLKSGKFVLYLLMFSELLRPFAQLSLCLQQDSVALLQIQTILDNFYSQLETERPVTSQYQQLISAAKSQKTLQFKGVEPKMEKLNMEKITEDESALISDIQDCVRDRFGDLNDNPVLGSLRILDTRTWPGEKAELKNFGHTEMNLVCDHFSILLEKNKVDVTKVGEEWDDLKVFWLRNLSHLSHSEMWKTFLANYRDTYPNLSHIITILHLMPASNAKVERAFSTMGRVKSDYRNRLGEEILDHLMRISIEGPQLDVFDPKPIVKDFFQKTRRPDIVPYGQKRKNEDLSSAEEAHECKKLCTEDM